MRLRKPTPSFVVAVAALMVSLGGTSYAVATIGSADIRDGSIQTRDLALDAVHSPQIADGTLLPRDFKSGTLKRGPIGLTGPQGPPGTPGAPGAPGSDGEDGTGRWVLIDANGNIEDSSGGFSVTAKYPTLTNTAVDPAPDNSLRANGNVYINANEDLRDNGIVAVIALQNKVDQNGDNIVTGRGVGPDSNPEFAGEISASRCAVPTVESPTIVQCGPPGTNTLNHFVVSPRNSDGSFTTDNTRKRFYIIITGDSSDFVAP